MFNFRNAPITTKFILLFLFIALLPLAVATYISYNSSQRVLKEEITRSLVAVAENKANKISAYLHEKERDLVRLSHTPDIIVAVEKLDDAFDKGGVDSPEYTEVDGNFRGFFTYYQRSSGYENLFVIRPYGDVIFSAKKEELGLNYMSEKYKDSQLTKLFVKVNISLEAGVSGFEYYPETDEAAVFIAAPVFKAGDVIGVVVAQMSNKGLYEFVRDYAGLGETGETVLVSKIGDEAVYISPLRFDDRAAFRRKVAIGSRQQLCVQQALRGEEGSGIFTDYRGKEVLAVSRFLPTFRLGMVVKMDTAEVLASANRLRNTLFKISLGLLTIVVIMAIIIARSVSSPIKELTKVSGTITGGDLTARARINAKDEIGELAQSFNQMTDSLVEAKANVEQKKEELEEQKKLLEKANKELDSFVYTASHDLRAPLRGIGAFASFLDEDYKDKLDEEGRGHVSEIRKGVDRMSRLIEDLLTLSRISRIQNPYEDVNINALIDSIVERIKFDIREYKVDLKIQENMPTVHCDRIKLGEVFLNLINNAVKFSSKNNKENPRVEVGYIDEDQCHKFYVRDNGIGIDPKYHDQVFAIFRRLHTDKEYSGTGAGLSIVKKVIDDHEGRIWVESELGEGATFYFTIPKGLVRKKKIGEILIEDGVITEEELKEALKKQKDKEGAA